MSDISKMSHSSNISLFLYILISYSSLIEYAEGTVPLVNHSLLLSQTSLKNSKTIFVRHGEEHFRLQCPISSNLTFTRSTLILWLVPNRHLVITDGGVSEFDGVIGKYSLIDSTGELEINNVSEEDKGIYRCVVREKRNQTCVYRTSGVNLMIEIIPAKLIKSEKRAYVHKGSVTRAMAAAGGAIFIFIILFTIHHFRWKRHSKLTDIHGASNPPEDVNNSDFRKEDGTLAHVPHLNILDSNNHTYVNKGFSINASPDKIYVIPELASRPSTSNQNQNQANLNLQTESGIGTGKMITVSPNPKDLSEEDIDGLSSCYPFHNPPFRMSSLQQSRREKRSQLRIKRWWLNPLPTGVAPFTPSNDGSVNPSESNVTGVTATGIVITTTPANQDDINDEDDARLQPHA